MIDKFENEYRFLSNFYPNPVSYEGKIWASVEHAYQAAKTDDPEIKEKIRNAPTPNITKRLGKKLILIENWDNLKFDIMATLVREKFKDPVLKQKLLDTGNQELIEGNWWGDVYWGVCKGLGQNNLGKILMQVREEIREDCAKLE